MFRVAQSSARVLRTASVVNTFARPALAPVGQARFLNVHEYVGMELMNDFGIAVPKYAVATSADDARAKAAEVFGEDADVVVKAQVLAGGRGLGHFDNGYQGGVQICAGAAAVEDAAKNMLGAQLITKQTGPEGKPCNTVLLTERVYMRRELYLSILMDRASGGPVIVASSKGGTSIEDIAAATPELIVTAPVDIVEGLTDDTVDKVVSSLGFRAGDEDGAKDVLRNLYKLFIDTDATLVEINPLAETPDGNVLVCDAKLNFDDNAAFRQADLFARRDFSQEDQREVEASKEDLNYIGLDGTIGCMVNGAGLAMATMDIIKLHGGEPANFLDVGGGATASQVEKAFELLNNDPKVKAILVNIFGGIMRCDVIATGIIGAASSIGLSKPVVVRLQGTNVEQAKALIESSGYRMILADDLDHAAEKAVRIADIVEQAQQINIDVKFELPL